MINILDFGADRSGASLSTKAIDSAIARCAAEGGGRIIFPAGTYLTGPVKMSSHTELHFEPGSRLVFTNDTAEYPVVKARWEGQECEAYASLFYGENLEYISLTGRGILDGQGEFWWKTFKEGTIAYPRPRFIGFHSCRNILIEGITLTNSPSWTVNPVKCENLTVRGITIKNPADSPNTDGVNPESCCNVHISDCHIDVGDDCVTIKSGTEGAEERIPCENITVTNCTMVHGHGGVVIGSEMSGDVRNVTISNCVFDGTDRGIRIKSRRGRGGVVEDIRVSNLIMRNVLCPFVINLYYFCGPGGKDEIVWTKDFVPVNEGTPAVRRVYFQNITVNKATAAAGFIYGLPEMAVEDIGFENILIDMDEEGEPGAPAMMSHLEPYAGRGFFCRRAENISFTNVQILNCRDYGWDLDECRDIALDRCKVRNGSAGPMLVKGPGAENILERDCRF